eukprot:TRINITY_DN20296_c0_g1_i1.p1 TRINITY_DN20296_c0_g1~~TRINITY_DN20296_c0_g1_i1.p1  ORF type:complete len:626 (-),score=198.26 TRINITY_DN20296_c0_g1_i1:202-2079(-)
MKRSHQTPKQKERDEDADRGRVTREWSRSPGAGRRGAAASSAQARQQPVTAKRVRKEIFENELGYKNESNPFGDSDLTAKFVWKKKNEYLAAAGLYRPTSKDQEVDRVKSKISEIHQVKKRRDEREVERKLLEQQRQEHDREKHDEEFGEWLDREESFHLSNAKARSQIRIDQGRERQIDLVYKALQIADGEDFEDMTILDRPPHQLFANMSADEVEETIADVDSFVKNDKDHKSFWKALLYCAQEAADAKAREKAVGGRSAAALGGMGAGVAEGVVSEIHELLCSKGRHELQDMLVEIKQSIQKGAEGMDTQFFDAVATKIPLYMARAEIEDWHIRAKKKSEDSMRAKSDAKEREEAMAQAAKKTVDAAGDWEDVPDAASDNDLSPELEPLSILEEARAKGAFSPVLEPLSNYDEQDLLDPAEDERIMRQVRETLIQAFGGEIASASGGADELDRSAEDALVAAEKSKGLGSGEAGFNAFGKGTGDDYHGEFALPKKNYDWEEKYKPRKPRFFNRVKTGYEWNKYNQTHYDHDNPPPKQVQGYKFNIFYPDLIDKTKAPSYCIEKSDTPETCILRFHAGPPYEDVAFKIVNREWHLSPKFGFRVVFDRGVLQLYFNFKRWRYRR